MRPIPLICSLLLLLVTLVVGYFNVSTKPSNPQNHHIGSSRANWGATVSLGQDLRNPLLLASFASPACIRLSDAQIADAALKPDPETAFGPLIDAANRLACDPWLCVPYDATDAYVESLALLVHSRLSPHQKVYIQYSDHLFTRPDANAYILAQARLRYPDESPDIIAQARFIAFRSQQVFAVFERIMGSRTRMVRVLASDSPTQSLQVSQALLSQAQSSVDALSVPLTLEVIVPPDLAPIDLSGFLVEQEKSLIPPFLEALASQSALARQHNLLFLASGAGVRFSFPMPAAPSPHAQSPQPLVAAPSEVLTVAGHHPITSRINQTLLSAWASLDAGLLVELPSESLHVAPLSPPVMHPMHAPVHGRPLTP